MNNKVELKKSQKIISGFYNFVHDFIQEWKGFNFKNPTIKQTKILIYVIPTLVCIIELIFLHNIFFFGDSFFFQLYQILGFTSLSDDPPLFSSFINFFFIKIFDSFIGFYLFQLFLSIIAITQSCKCLVILKIRNIRIIWFSFIFSIIPSTFFFSFLLGRDSIIAFCIVILIAILAQRLITKNYSIIFSFGVGLFSGFISLFRLNFVVWVLGIYVALLFIKSLPKLKILIPILTMFIIITAVDFCIQFFYTPTEVRSGIGLSVPLQVDSYILKNNPEAQNQYFFQLGGDIWNLYDPKNSNNLRYGIEINDLNTFLTNSSVLCITNFNSCLMGIWEFEKNIILGFSNYGLPQNLTFDDENRNMNLQLSESNISDFYADPLSFYDEVCIRWKIDCTDQNISDNVNFFLNLFHNIDSFNYKLNISLFESFISYFLQFQRPFFFYLFISIAFLVTRKKAKQFREKSLNQEIYNKEIIFFNSIRTILNFLIFFCWWYITVNALTLPFYDDRFFAPIMILEPLVFFLLGVYIFHYRKMKKTLSNSENSLKNN